MQRDSVTAPEIALQDSSPLMVRCERVVNAGGYGFMGGPLSPTVRAAMDATAAATWRLDEVHEWAGEVIARITSAEAGWVSSGAAAGVTLAAAACIAGSDYRKIDLLPDTTEMAAEIIIPRSHRNSYDRAIRTAGARIVEIGYPVIAGFGRTYEWELEEAISPNTVAVAFLGAAGDASGLPLRRLSELAHSRGIPVIVDAAGGDLPPANNLRAYIEAGADLVVFSGGKAIRGPYATGVIAGRADLIYSIRLQAKTDAAPDVEVWRARDGREPPHPGLGRSLKVSAVEIVGLIAALEEFDERDHDLEAAEQEVWLRSLQPALGDWPSSVTRNAHEYWPFYPGLIIETSSESAAREWANNLGSFTPSIIVDNLGFLHHRVIIFADAISFNDRPHVEKALSAVAKRLAEGHANR